MKKTILWIVMDLIFLIVFNIVFFMTGGTERMVSVWISYGFIHFAYFMLLLTPYLVRSGKSAAVFGFSLYSISVVYFFVEFIVGILFIIDAPESVNVPVLVQLIIAGIYGIMLISHMIANEHTVEAEEKRQTEIDYIKNATAKVAPLVDIVSDKVIKKKVEKLYDAIRTSPVKSHPNLAQLEKQILDLIYQLQVSVNAGVNDTVSMQVDVLLTMVDDRNRELLMLN